MEEVITPIGIKSNGVFSAQHQIDMSIVGFAGWCLGLVDDLDIVFMIDEGLELPKKKVAPGLIDKKGFMILLFGSSLQYRSALVVARMRNIVYSTFDRITSGEVPIRVIAEIL